LALRPASRLAGTLHGRQEQPDQRRDDRDDDKKFDKRKAPAGHADGRHETLHGRGKAVATGVVVDEALNLMK
jgi:hypothetical protein